MAPEPPRWPTRAPWKCPAHPPEAEWIVLPVYGSAPSCFPPIVGRIEYLVCRQPNGVLRPSQPMAWPGPTGGWVILGVPWAFDLFRSAPNRSALTFGADRNRSNEILFIVRIDAQSHPASASWGRRRPR